MLPEFHSTVSRPLHHADCRLTPIFSLGESDQENSSSAYPGAAGPSPNSHHRVHSGPLASLFRRNSLHVSTSTLPTEPSPLSPSELSTPSTSPTSPGSSNYIKKPRSSKPSKHHHSVSAGRFHFSPSASPFASSSVDTHTTLTSQTQTTDFPHPSGEAVDKQPSSRHSFSSRLHSAFHSRSSSYASTANSNTQVRSPTTTSSSQATSITSSPATPLPSALVQPLMSEKLLAPAATANNPSSSRSPSSSQSSSQSQLAQSASFAPSSRNSSQPLSLVSSPNCPSSPNPARAAVKETHHVNIEVHPVSGRKVLNTYEVIRQIGRGQHGKVKLARSTESGDLVVSIY